MKCASIRKAETPADIQDFNAACAERVLSYHRSMPEYAPTPLVSLKNLARHLGVREVFVKDESKRFGLNAFKGLGGSYAVFKAMEHRTAPVTFITATDGNHGRGVAWAASRIGCEAYVFMPKGTVAERLDNIRRLGAHAQITDLSYDDTVRYAAHLAEENGWVLVQDTAMEGYEEIPTCIMQGYMTMGSEIVRQLNGETPTHVFLQAGVGSMAAAMTAFFVNRYGSNAPKFIVVEPDGANCFYRTVCADDGTIHFCEGELQSIMAGLCCGEPCPPAWDILHSYGDFSLSCPDHVSADGMRILGNPLPGDEKVVSGESGAVGVGCISEIMRRFPDIQKAMGLDENSVVLCISTEGDTDKENYRRIVWDGAFSNKQ